MIKKNILIFSILFFSFFIIKTNCMALDFFQNKLNVDDNNLLISPAKNNNQDVQELLNRIQQVESKMENDQNTLKTLVDKKEAEYLDAKNKYNVANKQIKAVQAARLKLQQNF